MAYYTGPDFQTGITGLLNNNINTNTNINTNNDTRYGERIGDDGFIRRGPFTTDSIDTDGDGIDDRHQIGAGQPRIGSNPDVSPIFGGGTPPLGGSSPPPLGGGEGDALGQFPGVQGQNDPLNPANNQKYSYETYKGNTYRVDNFTGEVEEADMPFGTASMFASIMGAIPGVENYRFNNDLDLNTQQNLISAYRKFNPYKLSYPSTPFSKNKNELTNMFNDPEDKSLINEERLGFDYKDIFNDTSDLDTNFGTDELRNIFSPNEKLNLDLENSFDDLLNRIRKEDALDDLDLNSEASKDYAKKAKQAKALQDQQNARDLQKQEEKERQKQKQKNLSAFNERQKKQEEKEKEKQKQREGGNAQGEGTGPSGGCFVEGTPIQMADGTTKEITTINVGEETKGGVVQAKMEFMPQNIYNYKDVLVSGSHWVVEDNQLVAVEDSKHGVLTDRVEPVYTFKTSNNRIWIYDIEFGDFETGSDADWEPHFEAVRQKLNKELSEKTT
jgi:hypothetical protein